MRPSAGGLRLRSDGAFAPCWPRPAGRAAPCGRRREAPPRRWAQGSLPGQTPHTTPDVPFPGDDQASIMYTALNPALSSSDEDFVLPLASGEDLPSTAAAAPTAEAVPAEEQGGVPHRWQVVTMMALAFVCCNMDKVRLARAVPCAAAGWLCGRRALPAGAPRPADTLEQSNTWLWDDLGVDCHWSAGEHVCGGDPNGQGAGLERHRPGSGL